MPAPNQNNTKEQRQCTMCKNIKSLNLNNFHKDKSRKFGFACICIDCSRVKSALFYKKHPGIRTYSKLTEKQKIQKYSRTKKYLNHSPLGRRLRIYNGCKNADRERGRVFNLTKEYVLDSIKKPCVYCGEDNWKKIGLDRVDCSIGHTIENTVPCCHECNIAKFDNFTFDEMLIIGAAIRGVKQKRKNEEAKRA